MLFIQKLYTAYQFLIQKKMATKDGGPREVELSGQERKTIWNVVSTVGKGSQLRNNNG